MPPKDDGGGINITEFLAGTGYGDLVKTARKILSREQPDPLLAPEDLANEVVASFLKHDLRERRFDGQQHLLALIALQMRRLRVDKARAFRAQKRGGGLSVSLEALDQVSLEPDLQLIKLDDALKELEESDPKAAKVVELRFFGGYTDQETAEILGTNVAKVRRDWEFARAWLYERM